MVVKRVPCCQQIPILHSPMTLRVLHWLIGCWIRNIDVVVNAINGGCYSASGWSGSPLGERIMHHKYKHMTGHPPPQLRAKNREFSCIVDCHESASGSVQIIDLTHLDDNYFANIHIPHYSRYSCKSIYFSYERKRESDFSLQLHPQLRECARVRRGTTRSTASPSPSNLTPI